MATLFKSLLDKVFGKEGKPAQRNGSEQLPEAIQAYLVKEFRLLPEDMGTLRCIQRRESFARSSAQFVRIFDGSKACEQGIVVDSFRDLDRYPELILFYGRYRKGESLHLKRGSTPTGLKTK